MKQKQQSFIEEMSDYCDGLTDNIRTTFLVGVCAVLTHEKYDALMRQLELEDMFSSQDALVAKMLDRG